MKMKLEMRYSGRCHSKQRVQYNDFIIHTTVRRTYRWSRSSSSSPSSMRGHWRGLVKFFSLSFIIQIIKYRWACFSLLIYSRTTHLYYPSFQLVFFSPRWGNPFQRIVSFLFSCDHFSLSPLHARTLVKIKWYSIWSHNAIKIWTGFVVLKLKEDEKWNVSLTHKQIEMKERRKWYWKHENRHGSHMINDTAQIHKWLLWLKEEIVLPVPKNFRSFQFYFSPAPPPSQLWGTFWNVNCKLRILRFICMLMPFFLPL